ncbi:Bro-N domain-containing protein [Streptomyces sp. IB201691-2A2]|uniref:BRO-N domain-containing protein n=1 Tax=Streptomyces sp. IB201691-2A2 TaxID=2561920 RepID=UPI00117D0077|nr:Bro-N domain-containing protein [Streptomyces sp. IB201691-2A2]TRO60191.1 DNA-binding protein [Streptomyces sp. IB201691-2A2]
MYEQNNMPPNSATAPRQDAIDINDFVYAATGARVRRLTLPDGSHWFPAVDVCRELGYIHTGSALRNVADEANFGSAESVLGRHTLSIPAGREWRRDMNLVNLEGLIRLVNGCTKQQSQPFKAWVATVIASIQRDGSYSLEPAPVQPTPDVATAYVMPQQIADAIVRLEERNIRADELLLAFQEERGELLRQISRSQTVMAEALQQIAESLGRPHDRPRPTAPSPEPELTPQELLATWKAKNLVVTGDVHAVAAYLAPALLRGGARYRLEEIATRTGLPQERVHDCVRMLLKRGCVRQTGCAPDGAPLYVLP